MEVYEAEIRDLLQVATGLDEVKLERPPNPAMGDFAFACFVLAKEKKKSPVEIAQELKESLPESSLVAKTVVQGPYLNFFLNKEQISNDILSSVYQKREQYGMLEANNERVLIEYSAPNIAKPFGITHLRSTVIGNSLCKLYKAAGYDVVALNHPGDWGTPFGKMIVAFKLWGDEEELHKDPIDYLYGLYTRFTREAEGNEQLQQEARDWFKKLELGDEEAVKLWQTFKDVSFIEFNRIYDLLGVEFDVTHGESYYTNRMENDLQGIVDKGLAEESDGALVIDLSDINCPPLLLKKSDGATTYHLRDVSAALYRLSEYHPQKIVYVVGSPQKLHFKQLFTALGLMGYDADQFEHVSFGLIRLPEGKMSTRKGTLVLLDDVLHRSVEMVKEIIEEKNPSLPDKEGVARQVGIGAVIFFDLVNDRNKDVIFSWDRLLDFEGETGPYIQYTHARACSILRKVGEVSADVDFSLLSSQEEYNVAVELGLFSEAILNAVKADKPHIMCHYLIRVAKVFNEFYHACPVINDDKEMQKARALLVAGVAQVLKNGLGLLGIQAPEHM